MAIKASSQVSLTDITDAYSVILTSEAFTFVGNTSGAPSGLSCTTQVVAHLGATQCSKVSIGTITCPTGISASTSNNNTSSPTITFTTTATVTAACEATIPVSVDGVTINKKFSFAVAKTGATGANGKTPVKGTDYFTTSEINSITDNASATATTNATNNIKPIVEEASKTATNYMQFQNGKGLVIGDMTAGTLGNNVCIDSDSVDIRKGNSVVATFSDETVIGDTSGRHVKVNSDGLNVYNGSTKIGQIGYGECKDIYDANTIAPYYVLGERKPETSIGRYSVVEGWNVITSGQASHAEGIDTTASGHVSHAEGNKTTASGFASHTEGDQTTASGQASHAEGILTTASGNWSHAEGNKTTASGLASHAGGVYTIASGANQTAIGKYNVADTTSAFIVGNGTSDTARSNAMKVDFSGNMALSGALTASNIGSIYRCTLYSDRTTRPLNTTNGVALGYVTLPAGVYIAFIGLYCSSLSTSTTMVRYGWTANTTSNINTLAGNGDNWYVNQASSDKLTALTMTGSGYIYLTAQTTLYIRAYASAGYCTGGCHLTAIRIK